MCKWWFLCNRERWVDPRRNESRETGWFLYRRAFLCEMEVICKVYLKAIFGPMYDQVEYAPKCAFESSGDAVMVFSQKLEGAVVLFLNPT